MAASRGCSVDENSSLCKYIGHLLNRHLTGQIRGMNTHLDRLGGLSQTQSLIQMAVLFTQATSQ